MPRVVLDIDADVSRAKREVAELERRIHGLGGRTGAGAGGAVGGGAVGGGGGVTTTGAGGATTSQEEYWRNRDNEAREERATRDRLAAQSRAWEQEQREKYWADRNRQSQMEWDERNRARARGEIMMSDGSFIDDGSGRRRSIGNWASAWNPLSGRALGGQIAANFFGEFFGEMMAMLTMAFGEEVSKQMDIMRSEGGAATVQARGAERAFSGIKGVFSGAAREAIGLTGDIERMLRPLFTSEGVNNAITFQETFELFAEDLSEVTGLPRDNPLVQTRALIETAAREGAAVGSLRELLDSFEGLPENRKAQARTAAQTNLDPHVGEFSRIIAGLESTGGHRLRGFREAYQNLIGSETASEGIEHILRDVPELLETTRWNLTETYKELERLGKDGSRYLEQVAFAAELQRAGIVRSYTETTNLGVSVADLNLHLIGLEEGLFDTGTAAKDAHLDGMDPFVQNIIAAANEAPKALESIEPLGTFIKGLPSKVISELTVDGKITPNGQIALNYFYGLSGLSSGQQRVASAQASAQWGATFGDPLDFNRPGATQANPYAVAPQRPSGRVEQASDLYSPTEALLNPDFVGFVPQGQTSKQIEGAETRVNPETGAREFWQESSQTWQPVQTGGGGGFGNSRPKPSEMYNESDEWRVEHIMDGDTIVARNMETGVTETIRFKDTYAPERSHRGGVDASEWMRRRLPLGSRITLSDIQDYRTQGRIVANVIQGGVNVSEEAQELFESDEWFSQTKTPEQIRAEGRVTSQRISWRKSGIGSQFYTGLRGLQETDVSLSEEDRNKQRMELDDTPGLSDLEAGVDTADMATDMLEKYGGRHGLVEKTKREGRKAIRQRKTMKPEQITALIIRLEGAWRLAMTTLTTELPDRKLIQTIKISLDGLIEKINSLIGSSIITQEIIPAGIAGSWIFDPITGDVQFVESPEAKRRREEEETQARLTQQDKDLAAFGATAEGFGHITAGSPLAGKVNAALRAAGFDIGDFTGFESVEERKQLTSAYRTGKEVTIVDNKIYIDGKEITAGATEGGDQ